MFVYISDAYAYMGQALVIGVFYYINKASQNNNNQIKKATPNLDVA